MRHRRSLVVTTLLACCLLPGSAWGLIFYSTGDINHNTSAPTGPYADSGWQWEGAWGVGAGTVVTSKHFITSNHYSVGGTPPQFYYQGTYYAANTTYHDDPDSDLRIVEITGNFTDWAPLNTNTSVKNKDVVVFGRGYTRGDAVVVNSQTKGWIWSSTGSGTFRWGTNRIDDPTTGATYLVLDFDSGGTSEECIPADRDSGGGLFVNDGGAWKLAGVTYAADGVYDTDADHTSGTFKAGLYDEGGLYERIGTTLWTNYADLPIDQPGTFYASNVAARRSWILSAIPELALPLGDMDGSGGVNNNDITPFVLALTDRQAYVSQYGYEADILGDIDQSGSLNNNDISPFVALLTGAGVPASEMASLNALAVPEPAAIGLITLGGVALLLRRRRSA